jgi:hypothetical protein
MQVSRQLYMNDSSPSIDRPKPVGIPSEVLVWDNKCSALDAEWQCMPYALASCEASRGTDGYLQCLDDRFHACRRGAGCDYRYNTSPQTCARSPRHKQLDFSRAVETVCNNPMREYASADSYAACVERMREWSEQGCANLEPNEVSGQVIGSSGW